MAIEEQLVTLETAKLLKEKGFNEYCETIIREDNGRLMKSIFRTNKDLPKLCYSRPTQTIASKWLRDKKNLHVSVYSNACGWGFLIEKADNGTFISNDNLKGPNDGGVWDSYEEALEAGMKMALTFCDIS